MQPGTGAYLHVETAENAPPSVTEDWTAQEKLLAPRVSNYQRVALRPADGGTGERAADWEFTFGLAGSPLHAVDRGLVIDGTGYSLYWQTPGLGLDVLAAHRRKPLLVVRGPLSRHDVPGAPRSQRGRAGPNGVGS